MAFWEILHFRETVRRLQGSDAAPAATPKADAPAAPKADDAATNESDDAARASQADNLPHNERRDD
jgi:hypothetical protein